MQNDEVLLECRNVGFGYHKNEWILRGVGLTIRKGERVGLVGPSGFGKSTLAKIMGGYLSPSEGEVLWKGKTLPRKGYCPVQLIYQHPEKALNPRLKLGKSLCEGWDAEAGLLRRLCIREEWKDRWPNELSGGELQRFCVARVLGPKTEFILSDEMSTMLDAITQAQIWKVLLEEAEARNLGMLVVTHNMALAKRICTRIEDITKLSQR